MTAFVPPEEMPRCAYCGKVAHPSRGAAEQARRRQLAHLRHGRRDRAVLYVYRCPATRTAGGWHVANIDVPRVRAERLARRAREEEE